jgi:hypothetical protein
MFKLLSDEQIARQKLFNYFGYKENWRILPIQDSTFYFWSLDLNSRVVRYADTEAELSAQAGRYYETQIYTQRFLSQWVYRGEHYTMILTDPHVDMNQFLEIFTNEKERANGK